MERPKTPPTGQSALSQSPPTPEFRRRIEENRLKAKALRDQYDAARFQNKNPATTVKRAISSAILSRGDNSPPKESVKRPYKDISDVPVRQSNCDGRNLHPKGSTPKSSESSDIQTARKFMHYVDWDLSAMTDTKGGFLTAEDDPRNKALNSSASNGEAGKGEKRPVGMTQQEWEKEQLKRSLRRRKAGPFEPGLSVLMQEEKDLAKCRECGSLEVDWEFETDFKCLICSRCKEKFPEKYSLLTKTEVKTDYLLTDEELKDRNLLPHMDKPNPRASHWHDMMLFLRYQVEEYAFSDKKWGSADGLDAEYTRREAEKKKRNEKKFKMKIVELKKKTRTEAYRKALKTGATGGNFGDIVGGGKHEHEWGIPVENDSGDTVKTCTGCGMEIEELVF